MFGRARDLLMGRRLRLTHAHHRGEWWRPAGGASFLHMIMRPEDKQNVAPEVQAVVLAAGRGSRLGQLLSGKPKCLLPVCNKPMIQYPLELLLRHRITEAIVLVLDNEEQQIKSCVARMPLSGLRIEFASIPHTDDYGSADSLRAIRNRLQRSHLLLLSSDLVTNLDLDAVIRAYRTRQPTMLCVLSSSALFSKEDSTPGHKLDPNQEFDLVALDAADPAGRLVLFEPELLGTDSITVKRPMLRRATPRLRMRTDLADSHLYLFPSWLLAYLDHKSGIHSVRLDLLPSLVRKQFRPIKTTSKAAGQDDLTVEPPPLDHIGRHVQLPDSRLAEIELTGTEARYPDSVVNCTAFLSAAAEGSHCLRVNTLLGYCRANRVLLRAAQGGRLLDPSTKLGQRCTIRRSVVGANCTIGDGCTITNCIVQDQVTVQSGSVLSNCVVAAHAHIGQRCHLDQCVIGPQCAVPDQAHVKNETLVEEVLDFY